MVYIKEKDVSREEYLVSWYERQRPNENDYCNVFVSQDLFSSEM